MRYKSTTKMTCIHAENAETFEARINDVLFRVSFPKIEIDRNLPYTAYITYRTEQEIPETRAECYQVHGAGKRCGDCDHFRPVKDKRRKWHPCEYAAYKKTEITADACDRFYIEQEQKKDEERKRRAKHEIHRDNFIDDWNSCSGQR